MSMPSTKSTISRSWPLTFTFVGVGLVCFFITYAIFAWTNGGLWLGSFALAMAIVGFVCMYMAIRGAGQCQCPNCGAALSALTPGKNKGVFCDQCKNYFEGTGGQLWQTDTDDVAKNPVYTSPLPETFNFPDGCCVCGKPETKRVTVSTVTQGAGNVALQAATDIRSSTRISVQVPHCDEHKDGALLGGTKAKTLIRFRSYPYLRAFCTLNNTTPQ
jgi:hypothetical protein